MSMNRFSRAILGLALVVGAAGCNDDPNDPDEVATTLIIASGNQQVAIVGTVLTSPIVVKVVDEDGDNVEGAIVTWIVADGGGTLSAATSTTGTDGTAQVTWTLGLAAGTNLVTATVPDLTPVTFTATGQ